MLLAYATVDPKARTTPFWDVNRTAKILPAICRSTSKETHLLAKR